MKEYTPIKEGKVREVYDNGDSLIMVATDRISAFDHILKNKVRTKEYHSDVAFLVRFHETMYRIMLSVVDDAGSSGTIITEDAA